MDALAVKQGEVITLATLKNMVLIVNFETSCETLLAKLIFQ